MDDLPLMHKFVSMEHCPGYDSPQEGASLSPTPWGLGSCVFTSPPVEHSVNSSDFIFYFFKAVRDCVSLFGWNIQCMA